MTVEGLRRTYSESDLPFLVREEDVSDDFSDIFIEVSLQEEDFRVAEVAQRVLVGPELESECKKIYRKFDHILSIIRGYLIPSIIEKKLKKETEIVFRESKFYRDIVWRMDKRAKEKAEELMFEDPKSDFFTPSIYRFYYRAFKFSEIIDKQLKIILTDDPDYKFIFNTKEKLPSFFCRGKTTDDIASICNSVLLSLQNRVEDLEEAFEILGEFLDPLVDDPESPDFGVLDIDTFSGIIETFKRLIARFVGDPEVASRVIFDLDKIRGKILSFIRMCPLENQRNIAKEFSNIKLKHYGEILEFVHSSGIFKNVTGTLNNIIFLRNYLLDTAAKIENLIHDLNPRIIPFHDGYNSREIGTFFPDRWPFAVDDFFGESSLVVTENTDFTDNIDIRIISIYDLKEGLERGFIVQNLACFREELDMETWAIKLEEKKQEQDYRVEHLEEESKREPFVSPILIQKHIYTYLFIKYSYMYYCDTLSDSRSDMILKELGFFCRYEERLSKFLKRIITEP